MTSPQQVNEYNKHLPYDIGKEAIEQLEEIKYNLLRAVIAQELTPGVIRWSTRLANYMQRYGKDFSKHDHVFFIKLMYSLMTTPGMGSQYMENIAFTLHRLLSKQEMLTREDIELPWKPLYELVKSIQKIGKEGLERFPLSCILVVTEAIKKANSYFSADATKEMLLEFRPLLCLFDEIKKQAAYYFSTFLPTRLPAKLGGMGFKLWFGELSEYWYNFPGLSNGNVNYVKLFVRLAADNVGYIKWGPHAEKIFGRLLKHLRLTMDDEVDNLSPSYFGKWFVYMLSGIDNDNNIILNHLEKLFRRLKSFFHPSNHGEHSEELLILLESLVRNFTKRISYERYGRGYWARNIPQHAKINDKEIERFVVIVKDVAFLSMFGKCDESYIALILHDLALLRSDLILPTIVERAFESFETLVESHQLTSTLSCMTAVARSIVTCTDDVSSVRTNILPLLRLVLPGIDSNDHEKTICAFKFIGAIITFIPLVDCSSALDCNEFQLSDVERELSLHSAQFNDVVLQFLDRCFVLIDNSTKEHIFGDDIQGIDNSDETEYNILLSMGATAKIIFMQSSKDIFKSILDCLFVFVSTRVLEVNHAGRITSSLCHQAAIARPDITLRKFLPYICDRVENLVQAENVGDEEDVDPELLWYLEILSEILRCDGKHLLPYKNKITDLLRVTIPLKCKQAHFKSIKILYSLLCSLTKIYPLEWRSMNESFDQSPSEHFYIRDWGKPGDLDDLNIQWHMGSQEELSFADTLLSEFLVPLLNDFKEIANNKQIYKRETIQFQLRVLAVCVRGCEELLPMWSDDDLVEGLERETFVAKRSSKLILLPEQIRSFSFGVTRKEIVEVIHDLYEFMVKEHEDDTKSFSILSAIYGTLILQQGFCKTEFEMKINDGVLGLKQFLHDRLRNKKKKARSFLIERVEAQHAMRIHMNCHQLVTQVDRMLLDDLLAMSTSEYTQVRLNSQNTLFNCLIRFPYASRCILPALLDNIGRDVSHEKLKGTLHILSYPTMVYLISHYWEAMDATWVRIAQINQSEKASIISLTSNLVSLIIKEYETLKFSSEINKACIDIAKQHLSTCRATTSTSNSFPSEELLQRAEQHFITKRHENEIHFRNMEKELCTCLSDQKTHWRTLEMYVEMLAILASNENIYSHCSTVACVQLLVDDSEVIREMAIKLVVVILHQNKPRFAKIPMDYSTMGFSKGSLSTLKGGDLECSGNDLLQYQEKIVVNSQEELDKHVFIDKMYVGYIAWPPVLDCYVHNKNLYADFTNHMNESCVIIQQAFRDSEFTQKFIKFSSIDRNGCEMKYFQLFKGLFRNYGPKLFIETFKPVLEELLTPSQSEEAADKQCLASEIIGGLIRGSKHWNFEDLTAMWDFVLPLLQELICLSKMEKREHWSAALSYAIADRDKNRFTRLIEMLTENPLNGAGGSQGDAHRLTILIFMLLECEWRMAKKNRQLLKNLLPCISHPYQNVREAIASLFAVIFMYDVIPHPSSLNPSVSILIDYVIDDLKMLHSSTEEEVAMNRLTLDKIGDTEKVDNDTSSCRDMMLKTLLTFLLRQTHFTGYQYLKKEIYQILPLLIPMISREDDPEIITLCTQVFPRLSRVEISEDLSDYAVNSVIQVCNNQNSWKTRVCGLKFLQEMVVVNFFVLDKTSIKECLKIMLIEKLQDDNVEVQETASTLLSGLVHYGYFDVTSQFLNVFQEMAKLKGKEKKSLQVKHGGILGLSALVMAFPYDIEWWMPKIIIELGNHVHGIPRIAATAKRTLSQFKRTHQDTWRIHRLKFTEDQLLTLTDLLISPNYYA